MAFNYRQVKAKERQNKERILRTNPYVDENSGIYILTRIDEEGFRFAYIGQAKRLTTRLAQHLAGYEQHIDLSLKKHGLYSSQNVYGWKIGFEHFDLEELDKKEQYYIKEYAELGFQLLNKTKGSQGAGKQQLSEYKPAKTYRDGLKQGRKSLAKELSNIIEKHLEISLKQGKTGNKTSQKQLEKFLELLNEENYN